LVTSCSILPRCLGLVVVATLVFVPVVVVLANVTDALVSQQWGWYRVKADKALDTGYQGAGVVVALLDTGIDAGHPDLAANVVGGWNFVDNNSNVTDVDGHGTMVAGIVAAVANNSIGIAGVASKVSVMPLKVLSESEGSLMDVNAAIRYAADHGARIIGMSLGGSYSRLSQTMEAAIDYAYKRGCILVAGAGNDNSNDPFYPACYEQVIAVSAIDQADKKASFSNYGSYIDFCAPGVGILSTVRGGDYGYGDGTSFATPFVTGVVAVMLSKSPSLTNSEVLAALRSQAVDLGEAGWDQYFGWGVVDAYAAVAPDPIPEVSGPVALALAISTTVAILVLQRFGSPNKKLQTQRWKN